MIKIVPFWKIFCLGQKNFQQGFAKFKYRWLQSSRLKMSRYLLFGVYIISKFSCLFFPVYYSTDLHDKKQKIPELFPIQKNPGNLTVPGNLQLDAIVSYVLHSIFSTKYSTVKRIYIIDCNISQPL